MNYDQNNIFAKIIRKEILVTVFYENEFAMSFKDINPKSKIHYLVIPKHYYVSWFDFQNNASDNEILGFWNCVNQTVKNLNLTNGFRLICNNGPDSNQEVQHLHLHILGGENLS